MNSLLLGVLDGLRRHRCGRPHSVASAYPVASLAAFDIPLITVLAFTVITFAAAAVASDDGIDEDLITSSTQSETSWLILSKVCSRRDPSSLPDCPPIAYSFLE